MGSTGHASGALLRVLLNQSGLVTVRRGDPQQTQTGRLIAYRDDAGQHFMSYVCTGHRLARMARLIVAPLQHRFNGGNSGGNNDFQKTMIVVPQLFQPFVR
jgi:hypothetical protein